jgi:hypothetical protein
MDVPASLRTWFIVHFAVDVALALPLLLAPVQVLGWVGWSHVDPVTARLFGAALLGIGAASLATHRHGVGAYRVMLTLKIVWSVAAIFGLLAAIAEGAPSAAWALLSAFIALSGVWMSYAIRLKQMEQAAARWAGDEDGDGEKIEDGDEDEDEDGAPGKGETPRIS